MRSAIRQRVMMTCGSVSKHGGVEAIDDARNKELAGLLIDFSLSTLKTNGVLHGLGRLNISHLIMLRKVKFDKHLCLSSNSILYNLFYFTLIHNYTMLRTVFMPQCSAVDLVYHLFDVYVG